MMPRGDGWVVAVGRDNWEGLQQERLEGWKADARSGQVWRWLELNPESCAIKSSSGPIGAAVWQSAVLGTAALY